MVVQLLYHLVSLFLANKIIDIFYICLMHFLFQSNLNGKYFESAVLNDTSVHWESRIALKHVKMMIRPKVF